MDKRKEEIIEIALKRFCHYGFSKTTMNEIADDLRITKANLYYYYQDKTTLIIDAISSVAEDLFEKESIIIEKYEHNFLETLFAILELRASYLSKYYMMHINENLEWIKGLEINTVLESIYARDIQNMGVFFEKAKLSNDIIVNDLEELSHVYVEIMKSISIMYNVHDIMTGIPNKDNVNVILESQKRATKLIFEHRIITNK